MKRFKLHSTDSTYNKIMYHGTTPENAQNILRNGFDPTKSKYSSELHFTDNFAEASKYSKMANKGKLGVVLAVHKSHLNPANIISDDSGVIKYNAPIDKQHIKRFL